MLKRIEIHQRSIGSPVPDVQMTDDVVHSPILELRLLLQVLIA